MRSPKQGLAEMAVDPADDRILRAKYLDWCSAQVADRFLKLTPDEIYQLAHQARPGEGAAEVESGEPVPVEAGANVTEEGAQLRAVTEAPEPAAPGLSYRALVQRVTEVLTASMELPPFDRWVEAYRASPARFEAEMLGFWEEEPAAGQ